MDGISPAPADAKRYVRPDGCVITGPFRGDLHGVPCDMTTAIGGDLQTHETYAAKAVSSGWQIYSYTDNELGMVESIWYRLGPAKK